MALAHHGVLFLDELPEFQSRALEALRQPLETGQTVIARANHHVTYPARFQLVAAMNPCKCGMLSEGSGPCKRGPRCAGDYQARIFRSFSTASTSRSNCRRCDRRTSPCRRRKRPAQMSPPASPPPALAQKQRFTRLGVGHLRVDAEADGELLEEIARPEEAGVRLLGEAAEIMRLTARGYHRVLRVARTLADLGGAESVLRLHVAEALCYRQRLAAFSQAA